MKFLSLFSGIGGFDLGLEMAGMECIGQVENNDFCIKVLEKHWPNVKRIKDIHDVKGTEFGTVELICGGFPCQPFSSAGDKKGETDDRYLWPEMLRVIKKEKPGWVVGENVINIVNMGIEKFVYDLESIGYEVQCFDIPTCSVELQTMERHIWIVAASTMQRLKRCEKIEDSINRIEREFQRNNKRLHNRRDISETRFCRVSERVSRRMDKHQKERLIALGNAVPPPIVEIIGRVIIETENIISNAK